ncbi:hypothetical protein [Streptomyces sp. DSM 40750]|uniref:hypothetical protein n=1 Tax=Streptomyces sp. DSM 40750 TaxID=2801030 RepID=UPI00214BB13E|nr:hypothetical protein [Streptomyces sp. DSM 40750]UUU26580.1 hypothetical protein JIX55_43765 [Streptomyces sp. DSM 40750]
MHGTPHIVSDVMTDSATRTDTPPPRTPSVVPCPGIPHTLGAAEEANRPYPCSTTASTMD